VFEEFDGLDRYVALFTLERLERNAHCLILVSLLFFELYGEYLLDSDSSF